MLYSVMVFICYFLEVLKHLCTQVHLIKTENNHFFQFLQLSAPWPVRITSSGTICFPARHDTNVNLRRGSAQEYCAMTSQHPSQSVSSIQWRFVFCSDRCIIGAAREIFNNFKFEPRFCS